MDLVNISSVIPNFAGLGTVAPQISAKQQKAIARANAKIVSASTKAVNVATKRLNKITNEENAFTAKLITLASRTSAPQGGQPKGGQITNPARQAILNNLQLQFQSKIAKQGGNYQPIPLDSISPLLASYEQNAQQPGTPGTITTTTITNGVGQTVVTNPTGISPLSPSQSDIVGTSGTGSYYSSPASAGGGGGSDPGLDTSGGAVSSLSGGSGSSGLLLLGLASVAVYLIARRK